jgi:hypothetical protein
MVAAAAIMAPPSALSETAYGAGKSVVWLQALRRIFGRTIVDEVEQDVEYVSRCCHCCFPLLMSASWRYGLFVILTLPGLDGRRRARAGAPRQLELLGRAKRDIQWRSGCVCSYLSHISLSSLQPGQAATGLVYALFSIPSAFVKLTCGSNAVTSPR